MRTKSSNLFKVLFALVFLIGNFVFASAGVQATGYHAGVVYSSTNAVSGNAVVILQRAADGTLVTVGQVPTNGTGTGGGLGNQGAVILSDNGRWLYTVNAGSNSISVFRIRGTELELLDTVPSGGERPISLTFHRRLLYVLNAGGAGNISGFVVGPHGTLVALPDSNRPLSGVNTGPAQVAFSPNGRLLVVTEKATNLITTYTVDRRGFASDPNPQPSAGQTPFGFAFDTRGRLVVSEAFGGAAGAGVVSSYDIDRDGSLHVISGAVPDNQSAPCWIVITANGRYTYTTNTASNNVSGYRIGRDGSLTLLGNGVTGQTGSGPIDAALSRDSQFLYTLNSRDGSISAFRIGHDGSLTPVPGVNGLPTGMNGLAAR
jgi:6-phosphogluconolactonase